MLAQFELSTQVFWLAVGLAVVGLAVVGAGLVGGSDAHQLSQDASPGRASSYTAQLEQAWQRLPVSQYWVEPHWVWLEHPQVIAMDGQACQLMPATSAETAHARQLPAATSAGHAALLVA